MNKTNFTVMTHLKLTALSCTAAATLALLSSCASTSFRPAVFPSQSPASSEFDEPANELSADEVKSIAVIEKLPPGITANQDRYQASPQAGYAVLGEVATGTNGFLNEAFLSKSTPLYFYSYSEDESWRKPYCYWQVPLTWVSLSAWAFINPLYYPCWTVDTDKATDIANRKARMMTALQKGAKALGGDTIVLLDLRDGESLKSTQARALVLRKK